MRLCPKCGAENSDQRNICANCQEYIGNVAPTEASFSMEGSILQQEKRASLRLAVMISIILLFFGGYNVLLGITAFDLKILPEFFLRCLWFLPAVALLVLPYTRLFHLLSKKNPAKKALHFPFFALRILGVVGLLVNTCLIYNWLLIFRAD